MIHTLRGPSRRIAIVETPRDPGRRLGSVRMGSIRTLVTPDTGSITTLSPEAPSTAAEWLGQKIQAQAAAVQTTPGTLTYTPVPVTTPLPIARWNSWNGPCGSTPPGSNAASSVPASSVGPLPAGTSNWLVFAAVLGGAASLLYVVSALTGNGGR